MEDTNPSPVNLSDRIDSLAERIDETVEEPAIDTDVPSRPTAELIEREIRYELETLRTVHGIDGSDDPDTIERALADLSPNDVDDVQRRVNYVATLVDDLASIYARQLQYLRDALDAAEAEVEVEVEVPADE